jgi:hypothetical protein
MIINKRMENEFNLAPIENSELEIISEPTMDVYAKIDKITSALPLVGGLETADKELDELAEFGLQAHKELMELCMAVETKYSGEIASAASTMLAHAITAKTNKIKKKLDMVELQIKNQVADFKCKTKDTDDDESSEKGIVMNRNELLAHLLQQK